MKVSTNCDVCQFAFICPNKFSSAMLKLDRGGIRI